MIIRVRSIDADVLPLPRQSTFLAAPFELLLALFPPSEDIWTMRHVKNSPDNSDTATQTVHTSTLGPSPSSSSSSCSCVYFLRICASDGAHVFMHSGRTGAACNSSPACRSKEHSRCSDVSPRENKQNRGHFIQDGGTVKIRADLSSPSLDPPPSSKQGLLCADHSSTSPEGGGG